MFAERVGTIIEIKDLLDELKMAGCHLQHRKNDRDIFCHR
jgi:hypothetical protein